MRKLGKRSLGMAVLGAAMGGVMFASAGTASAGAWFDAGWYPDFVHCDAMGYYHVNKIQDWSNYDCEKVWGGYHLYGFAS